MAGGADSVNAFDTNQLSGLVSLRSAASSAGFNNAAIFFGVGSILFFYLFRKTNYIPGILSALGLFASVLVPIICFASLVLPQHAGMLQFC